MISIIIPVYNEEHILLAEEAYFRRLYRSAELIFVDGGSQDSTLHYARKVGRFKKEGQRRPSPIMPYDEFSSRLLNWFVQ